MTGMRSLAAAILLALSVPAGAQEKPAAAAPQLRRDIEECRKLEDKPGEIECYRELSSRQARAGSIADEWWLNQASLPSAHLVPYRPTYLIVRATDNINQQPTRVAEPQGFQATELKMLISFRGEFAAPRQFPGENRLRLWYAYTQQSNWQWLNDELSRPLRDSYYEPEIILTYDSRAERHQDAPSVRPAMANLGIVHQSNGRAEPESRTWWRTYLQLGWQLEAGSLLARVWRTWQESGMEADNPDINSYMGRGDLVFRTRNGEWGGLNVLLRSNLRTNPHRGFAQFDWRLPWKPFNIPWHLQLTSGYGETLLDYNHKQTTFGVGFSFWDW